MEKFLRLPLIVHVVFSLGLAVAVTIMDTLVALNRHLLEVQLLLTIALFIYWMTIPLALFTVLRPRISRRISLPENWFKLNWLIASFGLTVLAIATYIFEQSEFHLQGLLALLCFYFCYAFIYSFLLPARLLKIVEKEKDITYGESLGTFLALAFLPFSLLLLHKRILNALSKPVKQSVLI